MGGYISRTLAFTGRTGVLNYWRAQRPLALILMLGIAISLSLLISPLPRWTALIGLAPTLFAYVATIALGVRRLHDRGRSGWWLLGYSWPLAFAGVQISRAGGIPGDPASPVFIAICMALLAAFILAVWGWIDIGLLKGLPAPNRYGPAPT
tara:strand:+ start:162 stop:614 length:453 start_codon:yes stop_codon:yes gene_type:complete